MFDPLWDIPESDEEAKTALTFQRDDLTGKNLVGIYECRRAQGATVHEAYETALLAHIGAAQST